MHWDPNKMAGIFQAFIFDRRRRRIAVVTPNRYERDSNDFTYHDDVIKWKHFPHYSGAPSVISEPGGK